MGETRGRVVGLAVLAMIAVSIGALMGRTSIDRPTTTTGVSEAVQSPASREQITVHVSGMVLSPGVVDVSPDAIVADAIAAAGGLLPGAVVGAINLAAPVAAGDQIVVPGADGAAPVESGDNGPLSLNQASAADFERLPGVGPVLAERIVSFRESNGPFDAVEGLLEVPGIGEAKLEAIRDLVRP